MEVAPELERISIYTRATIILTHSIHSSRAYQKTCSETRDEKRYTCVLHFYTYTIYAPLPWHSAPLEVEAFKNQKFLVPAQWAKP